MPPLRTFRIGPTESQRLLRAGRVERQVARAAAFAARVQAATTRKALRELAYISKQEAHTARLEADKLGRRVGAAVARDAAAAAREAVQEEREAQFQRGLAARQEAAQARFSALRARWAAIKQQKRAYWAGIRAEREAAREKAWLARPVREIRTIPFRPGRPAPGPAQGAFACVHGIGYHCPACG